MKFSVIGRGNVVGGPTAQGNAGHEVTATAVTPATFTVPGEL